MGRKRSAESLEGLSEEERERRERQRELRQAALEAKAAGEQFVNPTKKKRKPLAARRLAERKEKRRAESAAARRAVQKEVKKQKAAAPDVVIVPIFWKGEAKQMAKVLSACSDVEAALKDCGKRVLLDTSHKYTPGQKFAHWEHKGVTLRVEVGPREAEKQRCTIARTFTPGNPAHRKTGVRVASESLPGQLDAMARLDPPSGLEEADTNLEADGDGYEDEEDDEVSAAAAVPPSRAGVVVRSSGDSLEDDFADMGAAAADGDEEEDDDTAKRSKKQSRKSQEKASKQGAAQQERPKKGARTVVVF